MYNKFKLDVLKVATYLTHTTLSSLTASIHFIKYDFWGRGLAVWPLLGAAGLVQAAAALRAGAARRRRRLITKKTKMNSSSSSSSSSSSNSMSSSSSSSGSNKHND